MAKKSSKTKAASRLSAQALSGNAILEIAEALSRLAADSYAHPEISGGFRY
jgi:hypothetical protein